MKKEKREEITLPNKVLLFVFDSDELTPECENEYEENVLELIKCMTDQYVFYNRIFITMDPMKFIRGKGFEPCEMQIFPDGQSEIKHKVDINNHVFFVGDMKVAKEYWKIIKKKVPEDKKITIVTNCCINLEKDDFPEVVRNYL